MNHAKRLLGLLFVGLASTALFIACGDSADSCLTDTDCETGFVCEQDLCVQTCTTRAECPSGSDCLPRASGAGLICVDVPGLNNEDNNTNNENNENNNNAIALYHILITDTTSGDGCTSKTGGESDPGSDIAVVVLEDEAGTVLGYGEAVGWVRGSEPNGNGYANAYANLDGNAPSFGTSCPESFNEDKVSSLGCGGTLVVNFLDGGNKVILDDSMQVKVVEYGIQCGGSDADTYRVSLCTDPVSAANGITTSCTIPIGQEGSGVVIAPITLP